MNSYLVSILVFLLEELDKSDSEANRTDQEKVLSPSS